MYNEYTIKEYLYKNKIYNGLFTTKKGGARVGLSVKFSLMNIHVPKKGKQDREKHPEAKYGMLIDLCMYFLAIYQAIPLIFG